MVEPAGGGDDQLARGVPALEVRDDVLAGGGADLLRGAADGASQRVAVHDLLAEALMDHIHGIVFGHGELLQDDAALGLHLRGVDDRGGDHIGEHLHGHGEVGVEHPGVVAGGLLAGHGVGLAADGVEGRGDLQG